MNLNNSTSANIHKHDVIANNPYILTDLYKG